MAGPRPLRWLHLSDLHLGCRGEDLWWQMQEAWEESVRAMARKLGPPDLLLVSGDLANRGAPEEYAKVDRLLDTLLGWLRDAAGGPAPLVVAVPGNHDLERPQGRDAFAYRVLDRYGQGAGDEDVRLLEDELWERRDPSFLAPLFASYQGWLERRLLPDLAARATLHRSHVPGDFCLELDVPEAFPLCLVGLNSTWQQYRGGDYERKLTIPSRQLQAALPAGAGGNPFEVFKRHPRALLMMHHPPAWLSPAGCQIFDEAIYPPGRFDLCLFGHLHQGRTISLAVSGGTPRYYFQAPSLFGLEHYGTPEEDRLFGYAWGTLSAAGEVRVRPLACVRRDDGQGAFVHDQRFPEDRAGVLIRRGDSRRGAGRRGSASPAPPAADFRSYLISLVDRTDHINISGIASGAAKGALRYPIEKLYTPLRSRDEAELGGALGGDARRMAAGRMELADLLPQHPRLLLEGQPGAGKTTFLRLAASLLGRDALGLPCPDGSSWRLRHLGLDTARPWVPVLLRISDLLPLLADPAARPLHDDRGRLLDLLEQSCAKNEQRIGRGAWRALLEGDGAILLLDGLDEVADEGLRSRVFEIFRNACQKWKCPIVVTSRPIETRALREMGFHAAAIEPFGDGEIRAFLDRWVAGLHGEEDPQELRGEAERYRADLLAAICGRPPVRRLATNPVMLTCLCVVHWNEGHLPEGRSRVYRAVIKWLIAQRTALRVKAGFTDLFAWDALARLALAMVAAEGGKRPVFDLEEGAVAIDPAVRRQFPDLDARERRREARRWLRVECLWSGIVEEVAGGRLRFWHLTFQEFLAALQLAWLDDGEDAEQSWWPRVRGRLDDAQWRETVELLPGCLLDEGGQGRVDRLLARVLALQGKQGDLAAGARVAGIAGRLLQSLAAYQYRARPELSAAYEALLERSLAIFDRAGAAEVPVATRILVAEALGRGGDPRLEPERDNFLEVPGTGGVRLGRYPVTVQEYQRFVESRGYEEPRHWDREGWALREKEGWESPGSWEEQLDHPNRPVTEVSWHEAVAYCGWLTEQRASPVRLPTEEEWERAATAASEAYPWGGEGPDAERANFDRNVGAPTPVGIYPAGDGPFGHGDLAGNVWEWFADDLGRTSEGEPARALRGGGWFNSAELLRAAFRLRLRARYRSSGCGFRVAAASASTLTP